MRGDAERIVLGPDSVGFELTRRGMVFGGGDLTTTDIAVRAGQASLGDPQPGRRARQSGSDATLERIHGQIEDAIDQMKTSSPPVPVILVGGGHIS